LDHSEARDTPLTLRGAAVFYELRKRRFRSSAGMQAKDEGSRFVASREQMAQVYVGL
jgi:hypothetical protein